VTTQATGRLVVDRPVDIYRDRGRLYDVLVDGARVGRLGSGERVVLDLPPGVHNVQARLGGTGSPPLAVTINPGALIQFSVVHAGRMVERYRRYSKNSYFTLQQH
jgi:hypothetical protein